METPKRKTTMTTTTTTTSRRTRNSAAMAADYSVHDSTPKTGRIKAAVGATSTTGNNNIVISDQFQKRKTDYNAAALLNQSSNSDSTEASYCSSDQKRLQQTTSSRSKIASKQSSSSSQCSPIKVLKKSRSEPFEGGVGESSESELRKAKSDNWNDNTKIRDSARSCNKMEVDLISDYDLNDGERVDDQVNDLMQMEDQKIDGEEEDEFDDENEQKTEDEVAAMVDNDCEKETEVVVSSEEHKMNIDEKSSDQGGEGDGKQKMSVETDDKDIDQTRSDDGGGGGGDDEIVRTENNKSKRVSSPLKAKSDLRKIEVDDQGDGERNKNSDSGGKTETDQMRGDNGGGREDYLAQLKKIKAKRVVLSPPIANKSNLGLTKSTLPSTQTPTTTASASASATHERPSSRSIHKSSPKSPIPSTTARKFQVKQDNFKKSSDVSKQQYDGYTTPETHHSKLQSLVDLVLWKDVSKTAFIFGFGTFVIISSSYAKDFNFSFISFTSYMSLVYLAVVFLYKSFMNREMMDKEDWPENYVWGEEEAMWFVKLVLPYMNEFLLKFRGIFSGDPAMTMKLAVVLFVLARCGSSITLWKTVKLGFFGVFVVPKLCASYSPQITAYGNFWIGRFRDAWESCSHKKALAFGIFTIVWNFSSVVARAWAAFMLFVALRYYQQSLVITQDFSEEQTESSSHNNVHLRHVARNRIRVTTSLDQRKLKKSF